MGKEIKNDYRIQILSELDNSEINKSLIKNVYNVSQKQLNTLGQKKVSLKKVEKALIQRDKEDTERKISPLIMTKNAVLVDTTKLTIKQMEAKLTNLVKNSIKKKYGNL